MAFARLRMTLKETFPTSASLAEWRRAYLPAADSKKRESNLLKVNENMKIHME